MNAINILLLGSGGREHAFARVLSQSPLCNQLYIAPGNPGTALEGINVDVNWQDTEALARFVTESGVSLVVVGR